VGGLSLASGRDLKEAYLIDGQTERGMRGE